MAEAYSRNNMETNACTYAINGNPVNACDVVNEQTTVVNDVVANKNVKITTETKNCLKDEFVYLRNDRVRQATTAENIAKEAQTFVLEEFSKL